MASAISGWYYLSAIILYSTWGGLLYYGVRRQEWKGEKSRLLFRYPLFYAFLFSSILVNVLRFGMASILGTESESYTDFYWRSRYIPLVLAIAIIWTIYRLAGRRSGWDYAPLLIFPGFILFESLRLPETHYYIIISNALLCFEAVLGLMVYMRLFNNRKLKLGSNLSGILMGLYIPCLMAWLIHTLYMFGAVLPYEFFAYVMEPITLLSWILVFLGMRRMDPPEWKDPPDLDGQVDEVFSEAVGAMRRMV